MKTRQCRAERFAPLLMAALVLGSMLAQLAVWPLHVVRQHRLREDMERRILSGLPETELTCLAMSERDLAAVDLRDGGRELYLDGVVYDIIDVERSAGKVFIKAVRDDPETRLNQDLDRLVRAEAEGEQGEHDDEARALGTWAPYYERTGRIAFIQAPELERFFLTMGTNSGRDNGSIEPGPPRKV